MALRFPVRTKGTTSQTGSLATFTVSEPATAGWRTFTKAVTDGDLANGDTVGLIIVDTTVSNGFNLLQVVTASWNNTTKQFTIVQNYQPSAPPAWGAGVRDVVVIDNPALFLLIAGGTMTGALKILLSGAIINPAAQTGLLVQNSSSASTGANVSVVSKPAGKAAIYLGDEDDEDVGGWYYDNATNELICRTNGIDRAKFTSSGALQSIAGVPYENFPGGGTIKWPFYIASAPDGWTKDTSNNDKALRVVSGGTGGTSGGTRGLATGSRTEDHTLTVAQMPSHGHEVHYNVGQSSIGSSKDFVDDWDGGGGHVITSAEGDDQPHSHTLSLAYIDVIICSKN